MTSDTAFNTYSRR